MVTPGRHDAVAAGGKEPKGVGVLYVNQRDAFEP